MGIFNNENNIVNLTIDKIRPGKYQPRHTFYEDTLEELAQSIKEHGIIQPIVVRKKDDYYEIIVGERRFRAALLARLKEVPVIIKNYNDIKTAEIAIIENIQREDLTSIEEAYAYKQLMELNKITQNELSKIVGKSQSSIANKLRLMKLPEEVKTAIQKRDITERHARALLKLDDEKQVAKMLDKIKDEHLTVKETESKIESIVKPKTSKTPKNKMLSKDLRIALNTVRQSVKMVNRLGLKADIKEQENDNSFELIISIPKNQQQ